MRRLSLMRHASAGTSDRAERSGEEDPPLTADGITKVRAAARGLAELQIGVSQILTSPLSRAVQTAESVSQVLAVPGDQIRRTESLTPGAVPSRLLEEIHALEAAGILCVGHSPQSDDVISHVLDCRSRMTAMKKAAVACMELDSVSPPGGLLLWLHPQKALRRLGK